MPHGSATDYDRGDERQAIEEQLAAGGLRQAGGRRHLVLPDHGTLLVFTDLHGNLEDFERLRALYLEALAGHPETHLALLGDLVHGPDGWFAEHDPALYGFEDRSWEVAEGVMDLRRRYPRRVHLLLGNHDHGHIGGEHTSKFHPDEVEHLESRLTGEQVGRLHALFRGALLMLLAPCGAVLAHGSPDDSLRDLEQLDALSLEPGENDVEGQRVLRSLLTSYGQQAEVTDRLLATLARETGLELTLVVHGHDRDEEGYFEENGNQVCPVLFGAPRESKRYLRLDLGAHYGGPADLRHGAEIRRLHGARSARP
jgi:hypothetical protein